jgi:hypothetical protein
MSRHFWSRATTRGTLSACAHLWNWFVPKVQTTRAPRKVAAKSRPCWSGPGPRGTASARIATGIEMRQLAPFVSTKSWRVMASGSR